MKLNIDRTKAEEISQTTDGEAGVQPTWQKQNTLEMLYSYTPRCAAGKPDCWSEHGKTLTSCVFYTPTEEVEKGKR